VSRAKSQTLEITEIKISENKITDKIYIDHFRCFQKLEVPDLKQINLLVGKHSSGKSAFLEAIFLPSSSAAPNASLQLRAIRHMGNQLVSPTDAQAYRGIWDDFFFLTTTKRKR
jgi:recombinational DNA repair ATPase RecF